MLGINELWQQNKALWRECFHDDEAFIDLYFSRVAKPENTYYMESDGRLTCVMQALPYELRYSGKGCRVAYLSGIATLPEFRGQGLATSLIRQVHGLLAERGFAASLLIPATDSLADFYAERSGYALLTRVNDERLEVSEAEDVSGFSLHALNTPGELADAYRQSSSLNVPRVWHSELQLDVVWEAWRQADGQVWALRNDGLKRFEGLAFCRRTSAGIIRISDCMALNHKSEAKLLSCLASMYGAAQLELKEQHSAQCGNGRPYAMIKMLRKDLLTMDMARMPDLRMNLMMDE